MPEHDTIQAYLETAGEQIRWGRARQIVIPELRQHLEDQRDAFLAEDREDAERLAVEEMGDPVSVGAELDRIHRPKPQWGLLALTVAFALAGAVLRVWLTADWAELYQDIDPLRTALAFLLGCGALAAGDVLFLSVLAHYAMAIYVGALAATALAWRLSPNVGGVAIYARYVVLCFPVVYACWLYTCRKKGWWGMGLALAGMVPLALACWMTPYVFALVELLLTGLVLLIFACRKDWFGIGRWKPLLTVVGCVGGLAAVFVYLLLHSGHAMRRLAAALHPEADPLGMGYYALTARRALAGARWWGQGTWSGTSSYAETMPCCESDNLLTTLIHQLGWGPFLLVVLTFAVLLGWLAVRCLRQKSRLGQFLVIAVVMMLGIQALFSVAWNLGFTWNSALFPLMIGNTASVVEMGLIGLALSAFRGDSVARDESCDVQYRPRYRIRVHIEKL
mgnify:CR=1 FL=1